MQLIAWAVELLACTLLQKVALIARNKHVVLPGTLWTEGTEAVYLWVQKCLVEKKEMWFLTRCNCCSCEHIRLDLSSACIALPYDNDAHPRIGDIAPYVNLWQVSSKAQFAFVSVRYFHGGKFRVAPTLELTCGIRTLHKQHLWVSMMPKTRFRSPLNQNPWMNFSS